MKMKSFLACAGAAFAVCGPRVWGFNSYLAGLRSFSSDSFDVPVLAARKGYRRPIKPLSPRAPEAADPIASPQSMTDLRTMDAKKQRKRSSSKVVESREINSTVTTIAVASKKSATFLHDNGTVYSSRVSEASKAPTFCFATTHHANDTTVQQKIDTTSPRLIEILNTQVARELASAVIEPKEVKKSPYGLAETALPHNQKFAESISLESATSEKTNKPNTLKPTSYSGFGVKPTAPPERGIESYLGTIGSVKAADCVVTEANAFSHKIDLSLSNQDGRSDQIDTTKMVQTASLESGASEIRNQNESPGLPALATTASSSYSMFGKKPWAPKYTSGSYLSHLESVTVPHLPVPSSLARSLSPAEYSSASGSLAGLASSGSHTASDMAISQRGHSTDSNGAKMCTGDCEIPNSSSNFSRSMMKTAESETLRPITDDGLPREKSTLDDSVNEKPLLVTTPTLKKKLKDYSGFGVKPKAPPRSVSTGVYTSVLENGRSGTLDTPNPTPDKAASNELDNLSRDFDQDRCEATPTNHESGTTVPIANLHKRSYTSYSGIGVKQPAPKLSGYANNLGFACDDPVKVVKAASAVSSEISNLSFSSSVSLPKASYTGFGVKPKASSARNNGPISPTTVDATAVHESGPVTQSKMEAVTVSKSSYTGFGTKPRALTTNDGSYVASLERGVVPAVTSYESATPVLPAASPMQRKSYTGFGVKPRAPVVLATATTTNAKTDDASREPSPTSDASGNDSNSNAPTIPSTAAIGPTNVNSAELQKSMSQPKTTVFPPPATTSYSGFGAKPRVPSVPCLGDTYLHQLQSVRPRLTPVTPSNKESLTVPSSAVSWIQPSHPADAAAPTDIATSTSSGTNYLSSLAFSAGAPPAVSHPATTPATKRSSYAGFGGAATVAWKTTTSPPRELLTQGTGSYSGASAVGGGAHNATLAGAFE